MLTPDALPQRIKDHPETIVVHRFPEEWAEEECRSHLWGDCPCSPRMSQLLGEAGYRWLVDHRRIPRTEEIPL